MDLMVCWRLRISTGPALARDHSRIEVHDLLKVWGRSEVRVARQYRMELFLQFGNSFLWRRHLTRVYQSSITPPGTRLSRPASEHIPPIRKSLGLNGSAPHSRQGKRLF